MASTVSREDILEQVRDIVIKGMKDNNAVVYLFGSWARHEEKRTSDIDVAVAHDGSIPADIFVNIRENLEESTVPYRVDLVDLLHADPILVKKIREEGVIWQDCRKE